MFLKIPLQASEISDRLVDTLLAGGSIAEAREQQQRLVEARSVLYGRHLLVAQSFRRLAALQLQSGLGEAAKLADNFLQVRRF